MSGSRGSRAEFLNIAGLIGDEWLIALAWDVPASRRNWSTFPVIARILSILHPNIDTSLWPHF
jgi:hypothetical protein